MRCIWRFCDDAYFSDLYQEPVLYCASEDESSSYCEIDAELLGPKRFFLKVVIVTDHGASATALYASRVQPVVVAGYAGYHMIGRRAAGGNHQLDIMPLISGVDFGILLHEKKTVIPAGLLK
jgi:hypothetical protein